MATGTTLTAILICLFLVNIIGSNPADAEPAITASPDQINLGLTDALDVNCSVTVAGWTNVAALISLTVSRTDGSQVDQSELAIISDFSSGQVSVMTTENLTADGWFNASGSASISLHWDYPTDEQAGAYFCNAQGFDPIGHSVEMSTQVHVSSHTPALADWQAKVIQMDQQMKSQNEKIDLLQQRLTALSQVVEFSVGHTSILHLENTEKVVYDKVFTNTGDGYDPQTGIFTSPIAGLYVFHWHGLTARAMYSRLALYHRNNIVASFYASDSQDYGAASNTVILNVTAGDQVYIAAQNSANLYGVQTAVYGTFSGYLLSTTYGLENVILP